LSEAINWPSKEATCVASAQDLNGGVMFFQQKK